MNLRELAEHLQLSPTTVSRALNGYPEVREETRRRVSAAATALNYQPSHNARQLATGRSSAIAHVIQRSQHAALGAGFADSFEGFSDASSQQGFDTQLSVVDDDQEEAFYCELAASRRVDGVVLHAPTVNDERIKLLDELGLPFVVHGRSNVDVDYSWLDVNNRRAICRATDFLLDLGHQNIALLNGPEHMNFAARRRLGYTDAIAARGLSIEECTLFSGALTEAYGYNTTERLLAKSTHVSAVVVCGIVPAFGALRALHTRGMTAGKDYSIIAFDDQLSHLQNSGDIPLFTAVRSSLRQAGTRIVELLIERIANPQSAHTGVLWEAELLVGQSTGRPR